MKKIIFLGGSLFILFISFKTVFAQMPAETPPPEERHEAQVTAILEEGENEVGPGVKQPFQKVEAAISEGPLKGQKVEAQMGGLVLTNDNQRVKVGDKISVAHIRNIDGSEQFYVADFIRTDSLYLLMIAFLVSVVAIGGLRGLSSFIGLVISLIVLIKYIIPKIASGGDPVFIAVSGSLMILIASLYLAHGFSKKTTAAVLGTFFSLILTAFLASLFVSASKLSGFGSEEASFLSMFPGMQVNLQGILLGGIIIGSLGVLDDITISQSACVFELKNANKNLSWKELYIRGLRIGREHIASLVNTLVLAYAGASLPLLLLFTLNGGEPINVLLNREMIATEIVRTVVGSLGLVAAVPITTAIAAFFNRK
ncbi:YibE/F family protein [Candidatus Daviesbacteria bacterium]|nr:YibE/F family protein [Candidatus Daviesbacteria bacterium]